MAREHDRVIRGARRSVRGEAAATLALLVLVASAMPAAADAVAADADAVTLANQPSRDLGAVAPSEAVQVPVSFELQCSGSKHVDEGQLVRLTFVGVASTAPAGGSLHGSDTSIGPVPAPWPDDTSAGLNCGTPPPSPLA